MWIKVYVFVCNKAIESLMWYLLYFFTHIVAHSKYLNYGIRKIQGKQYGKKECFRKMRKLYYLSSSGKSQAMPQGTVMV